MSKLQTIINALIGAEEQIVPLFVHNPNSQKIAAVIIAAESQIGTILSALGIGGAAAGGK